MLKAQQVFYHTFLYINFVQRFLQRVSCADIISNVTFVEFDCPVQILVILVLPHNFKYLLNLSVSDECYFRNASCALNCISTFVTALQEVLGDFVTALQEVLGDFVTALQEVLGDFEVIYMRSIFIFLVKKVNSNGRKRRKC